jgi:hypothetical protein
MSYFRMTTPDDDDDDDDESMSKWPWTIFGHYSNIRTEFTKEIHMWKFKDNLWASNSGSSRNRNANTLKKKLSLRLRSSKLCSPEQFPNKCNQNSSIPVNSDQLPKIKITVYPTKHSQLYYIKHIPSSSISGCRMPIPRSSDTLRRWRQYASPNC